MLLVFNNNMCEVSSMFKYSENDLYVRCGYDENFSHNYKKNPTGPFAMNYDTSVYNIQYAKSPNDGLSKHLVLKTFKGFIKVSDINKFSDIFDDSKYLKDQTNWAIPYLAYKHSNYGELIIKLANVLEKHWGGNPYQENLKKIIKRKTKVLKKTKNDNDKA